MQREYNPYRWEYTVLTYKTGAPRIEHPIWEVQPGSSLYYDYINNNRRSDDYWRF